MHDGSRPQLAMPSVLLVSLLTPLQDVDAYGAAVDGMFDHLREMKAVLCTVSGCLALGPAGPLRPATGTLHAPVIPSVNFHIFACCPPLLLPHHLVGNHSRTGWQSIPHAHSLIGRTTIPRS